MNVNIYPVLATWKKTKDGKHPLHLSIDLNGKRAAFPSLKRKLLLTEWDSENRCVKKGVLNADIINALIKKRIGELDKEYTALQLLDVTLDRAKVKSKAKNLNTQSDYFAFCERQINEKNYSKETKRSYLAEIEKIKKFAHTVVFSDITFSFLQRYESYMRNTLLNHDNTVWKTLKFHNVMLNDAVKTGGYLSANPFAGYDRGKYTQGIPDYLEWHEYLKIKETVINRHDDNIRRCGLRFLLSCVSGLRFGDVMRFTYKDFVIVSHGGERLLLYAEKNGEIISIGFTTEIAEIVGILKNEQPFSITNQEFNRCLKTLGGIAGISKQLHHHMGRHTFGMRCAELGLSIDDTQKLMGHRDRKSTLIYFRIKNPRLDEAMNKWNG